MSGQYLNEEKYQRKRTFLNIISWIMILVGITGFIGGGILLFGDFVPFERMGLVGFGWILGFAMLGFGIMLNVFANSRSITAYAAQSQIPVAKEAMKEMTPAVSEAMEDLAPAAGEAAKEIAKGIKEGLKD